MLVERVSPAADQPESWAVGHPLVNPVNLVNLVNLKRVLGVKSSATNWPVLRECGQEPLQFYWFRATIKFFNCMLESNSATLRQVLKADLRLAERDETCWSAHVSAAFGGMHSEDIFKQKCGLPRSFRCKNS